MALTVTSLNGAVALNATYVTLTAHTTPASGAVGPREFLLVDNERMQVTDATLTPTLQVTRGAQGTQAVAHNTVYITKASALGTTILDPAKDQTNTIKFVSLTAAAHLITFTTSIYGNTTSSDVLTFPATVGACFTMCARNGLWQAVATADDGATIG